MLPNPHVDVNQHNVFWWFITHTRLIKPQPRSAGSAQAPPPPAPGTPLPTGPPGAGSCLLASGSGLQDVSVCPGSAGRCARDSCGREAAQEPSRPRLGACWKPEKGCQRTVDLDGVADDHPLELAPAHMDLVRSWWIGASGLVMHAHLTAASRVVPWETATPEAAQLHLVLGHQGTRAAESSEFPPKSVPTF